MGQFVRLQFRGRRLRSGAGGGSSNLSLCSSMAVVENGEYIVGALVQNCQKFGHFLFMITSPIILELHKVVFNVREAKGVSFQLVKAIINASF